MSTASLPNDTGGPGVFRVDVSSYPKYFPLPQQCTVNPVVIAHVVDSPIATFSTLLIVTCKLLPIVLATFPAAVVDPMPN